MEKNRQKVISKIKSFYKRGPKAVYFKVSNGMLNDTNFMNMIIKDTINRLDKHPTWCRDISVQIHFDKYDFTDLSIVRIDYTYPKAYKS
jgi:menaquinone-dependent protoporphyrinogen IX oxidase